MDKPDLTIYFDGACEPRNPGGVATAGWYILDRDGGDVAEGYRVVARGAGATNNVAEWSALGFALRWLLDHRAAECRGKALLIHGDSQLVCCQLTSAWGCNKEHLRRLRARCWEIIDQLGLMVWRAEWVPRERNARADELSRRAYVECTGRQPPERRRSR